MIIYYAASSLLTLLSFLVLFEYRNVSIASLIPMTVLGLLVFWSVYYRNQKDKTTPEDTAYTVSGERFTIDERIKLYVCLSKGFQIMIPLCFPFIFFFNDYIKIISVTLYFVGIILGRIIFGFKYSKQVEMRIKIEQEELESQLKKEENGEL